MLTTSYWVRFRALTKTLTTVMQKHGHGDLFTQQGLQGCGDEADIALLLARANTGAQKAPERSLWSRLQASLMSSGGVPLPLLLTTASLAAVGLLWALLAPQMTPGEIARLLMEAPSSALAAAAGVLRGSEPGYWETAQLWFASLVYGILCWVPGICSSGQPVGPISLWSVVEKLSPF